MINLYSCILQCHLNDYESYMLKDQIKKNIQGDKINAEREMSQERSRGHID